MGIVVFYNAHFEFYCLKINQAFLNWNKNGSSPGRPMIA